MLPDVVRSHTCSCGRELGLWRASMMCLTYEHTYLPLCVNVCLVHVVIWRSLIVRNGGKITESLDLSLLSKVSDGFTGAQMNTAIQQILTERRIHQVGCFVACTCLCAYRCLKFSQYTYAPSLTHYSCTESHLSPMNSLDHCAKLTPFTRRRRRPSGCV